MIKKINKKKGQVEEGEREIKDTLTNRFWVRKFFS